MSFMLGSIGSGLSSCCSGGGVGSIGHLSGGAVAMNAKYSVTGSMIEDVVRCVFV